MGQRNLKKPLSLLSAVIALGTILYVIFQLIRGQIYLERLNDIDGTTLILVALLMLRGVYRLREEADLQTVSLSLIASVSFIFGFEAIYKWSFYFYPWRMPPAELREFIVQVGVSLVVLAGFGQKKFRFTRGSWMALAIFIALWGFWLMVGFPQLWDGQARYLAILPVHLSWNMIYLLNRCVKAAFMMVYYFLFA
jgi:hypothetical protein